MRRIKPAVLLMTLALVVGAAPASAASTTPIQDGVYDYSPHHTMYWLQVLAFPKQHKVAITFGSVAGCQRSPQLPNHIRLRHGNRFAASGSAPADAHHRAEHISITGRFVTRTKARATLTDCNGHHHRLILIYKGLAGLGPARASTTTHTKVKVNANPAVGQLSKLHQRANGLSGSPDNKVVEFAGDMAIATHDDYVVIAKAEGIPSPSSPSNFDAGIHVTKNVKINVDRIIAKMTKQHCGFVKKYPKIPLASGLAPIIKGLWTARNKALKAAGSKPIKMPPLCP